MSDGEDQDMFGQGGSDPAMQEVEEDVEQDGNEEESAAQPASASKGKGREYEEEEEEEEERDPEEEEDDEEDEEDDEEEEEDSGRRKKQKTRHRKKPAASRFLDIEAEVSDDEDEEEDEEYDGADGFIEAVDEGGDDDRRHHALLDKKRQIAEEDKSPEQIARDLSRRYGQQRAVCYTGDMNEIPQRLLMPSVHDASLWQVRVKVCTWRHEREIVYSLMRKAIDVEFTANPLNILAAFQRDSLPGMIYVEVRSSAQVAKACNGLVGVYPSRGIQLVPIEEMASPLQIKKQDITVTPGSWVRTRRGKYQGDLAQVVDVTENGEDVGLRFIPRIDPNPTDDGGVEGSKKRKKTTGPGNMRPPQRLFNYEEIIRAYERKLNETYKDGLIEKDFKLSALILEDVNPTLDEITQFTRKRDETEHDSMIDLLVIAEASRKAAIAVLQPGDHVEVFEGEQAGVHGVVDEINQDVVTITAIGVEIDGQKVELPARSVRKRFKPGDHVKVMTGQNADETGLVVSVTDNVVTFISDMTLQEVSVFSKDLREAAEVGSSTNAVGNYELHDLVQLDVQTVDIIFKTERDSFRVLDQNGQVRLVKPHQISMRRDSNRAIATDAHGHELRINDNMKEMDGEGRKGRILHIHQSFYAFLHNRDIVENGGVFVTRARSLVSVAPKGGLIKPGTDLSKMNPAMIAPTGGMVGSGNMGRGPRDRDIGLTVWVVKGAQKGYVGTIRDTNGTIARVELRTGNKIISIDKKNLHKRIPPDGKLVPLDYHAQGQNDGFKQPFPRNNGGGRTPSNFNNAMARTPNPYNDARTPAWNASSRTPNPYAESGKTPAWNASSRTPNPYADGGRTPAWNANSRTPNPYASGGGSSGTWGGATPGRTPNGGGWGDNSGWGTSPERTSGGWGSDAWTAPTPAAAPTPASAPTPALSAPTPAASHTPAAYRRVNVASAPTPGAGLDMYNEQDDIAREESPFNNGWLFDSEFSNVQQRLRVIVKRTRHDNYLNGDLENHEGRVMGAVRVGDNFEQSALIKFEDGAIPQRTILTKYLDPAPPKNMNDEAVILDGKSKGVVVVVRESPDVKVTVSTKADPSSIFEVPQDELAMLYPEP
ncbi:transcription elongation factor Spt5 [Pluteus cervinus]|uniref:Transcription elongation factor Spt5 n=1 Tax=Pluteus cervinus TaxID=181527 RepID=A0ACD3BEX2_9AGAR|nr:transcription elongation factor Spt5 [Pluteus cervinus]